MPWHSCRAREPRGPTEAGRPQAPTNPAIRWPAEQHHAAATASGRAPAAARRPLPCSPARAPGSAPRQAARHPAVEAPSRACPPAQRRTSARVPETLGPARTTDALLVPVLLAALQRVADGAVGPLHLGVGVSLSLVFIDRGVNPRLPLSPLRDNALDEGAEHLARH